MSSLADRISRPDSSMNCSSWADESANAADASSAPIGVIAGAEKEMDDAAKAQSDGASGNMGGSMGIVEPNYDVEVSLRHLQADPNDPLYSAKSFEELGL